MGGVSITDPKTALKASAAALVAGRVLFPDVNGNIVQDSNLFWDNTNKRFGVGKPIPTSSLEIIGIFKASDTDVGSALMFIEGGPTDGEIGTLSNHDLLIITNSLVQVRLDKTGKFGLGKTPAHQLDLSTDDAGKTTTNTWTITSDKRLKKNITPFTDGLATLLQLNPINFQYTGDAGTPKDEQGIGLAAQDVEAAIPYCIRKTKGKIKSTDVAETDIYKMNNHALVYVLVNAVKELDKRLKNAGL